MIDRYLRIDFFQGYANQKVHDVLGVSLAEMKVAYNSGKSKERAYNARLKAAGAKSAAKAAAKAMQVRPPGATPFISLNASL